MTFKEAAILVEKRLGLPASERLRVLPYVVEALLYLSRKLARERDFLAYVLSNRTETTAAIVASDTNGYVELSDLMTGEPYILLDMLKLGKVYSGGNKCVLIDETQAKYDVCFSQASTPQIWLTGTRLNIKGVTNGNLEFEVPCRLKLSDIPEILEDRLIDKAAELAAEIKSVIKPDYAEDGVK